MHPITPEALLIWHGQQWVLLARVREQAEKRSGQARAAEKAVNHP